MNVATERIAKLGMRGLGKKMRAYKTELLNVIRCCLLRRELPSPNLQQLTILLITVSTCTAAKPEHQESWRTWISNPTIPTTHPALQRNTCGEQQRNTRGQQAYSLQVGAQ
jgi:hypothetical protein